MAKRQSPLRKELASLKRELALASRQLDEIEARARGGRVPPAGGERIPLADSENRFASLVALGLSQLPDRLRRT
jgi:hypothetical protein